MSVPPPRISRWFLSLLVPAAEREFSLGDLDEEFSDRNRCDPIDARRWYRRQIWRGLLQRLRRAPGAPSMPAVRRLGLIPWMAVAWQDVRYAARSLRRSPGFVAVTTLTLALGVGATASIYAVIDAVLLRGLPFKEADRLVVLRNTFADGRAGDWLLSFPEYEDFRDGTDGFEALAAWQQQLPALSSNDGRAAQRLNAVDATAELLPLLGVEPILGRGILAEEDSLDSGRRTAVLSHSLWQSRFGGDPAALDRTIRLDDLDYRVVGILPRGFTGVAGGFVLPGTPVDVWLSYRSSISAQGSDLRGLSNVNVIGRLRPDVSLEQVQAQVAATSATLLESYPGGRANTATQARASADVEVGELRQTLFLTFGAVGVLLLIACTNVANLLIGRAAVRQREIAVRAALGAGRARIVRQLIAESVLLSIVGAGLGSAVAWMGVRGLQAMEMLEIARLGSATVDTRVLGFLFVVALLTGLGFGVGPALQSTRGRLHDALRREGRSVAGSRSLTRQTLVVAQIALAVVLLVGAGLLLRSLDKVLGIDPGYRADGVLTARVRLPMPFVSDQWPQAVRLVGQLVARVEALPNVTAAAAAYQLPTDAGWNNAFEFENVSNPGDGAIPLAAGDNYTARFSPVSPGYFALAGIELKRGRTFTGADGAETPRVVVVNQAFAHKYFPAGFDPIGSRLIYGNWWAPGPPEYEIVGVVNDVRFAGRSRDTGPATYFAHAQQPVREMSLLIRTTADPLALVGAVRAELEALDPSLPLDNIALLADQLAAHEASRRSLVALLGIFAASALTLAAIGVYGVMAFLVAGRTRELGIRVALGARRQQVRRMVLGHGLRLTAVGVSTGLVVAYGLGGVVERLLYQVAVDDLTTFATVAAFLALTAVIACWLPARRATRVDPMESLRAD